MRTLLTLHRTEELASSFVACLTSGAQSMAFDYPASTAPDAHVPFCIGLVSDFYRSCL